MLYSLNLLFDFLNYYYYFNKIKIKIIKKYRNTDFFFSFISITENVDSKYGVLFI